MMSSRFLDAKVRHAPTLTSQTESPFSRLLLIQGGAELVVNSAGPVSSQNQSKSWLLFRRDVVSPPGGDVSV